MPVTISSRITANDGHRGEVSNVSQQSSRAAEMLLSAELTLLTFDDPPAAFLAPDAITPQERSSEAYAPRPQAQRLQHVRASAHAAVDVNFMLFQQVRPPLMQLV